MIDHATIERLAREAGAIHTDAKAHGGWTVGLECFDVASLARFAALIEAQMRERCALAADEQWVTNPHVSGGDAIRAL